VRSFFVLPILYFARPAAAITVADLCVEVAAMIVVYYRHLVLQLPFAVAYGAGLHSYVRHPSVLKM
jgi:hypothetical protein